jgi:hypothetical protein
MKPAGYTEPVSQLLTYGKTDWDEWDDYTAFGFTSEHIPELIRLGTDRHLLFDDVEEDAMWAPMHAWRVLAQMDAHEAITPLMQVLALEDEADSDLISEGLQDVLERFGPAAIDSLTSFMFEAEDGNDGLIGAGEALASIGRNFPETRDRMVQIISTTLEARYAANDPQINGFWVSDLIDLKAIDSFPTIKKAYEAKAVDPMVCGDLEDVELELGLIKERTTPRPITPLQRAIGLGLERGLSIPKLFPTIATSKIGKKEKTRRKKEKESRKKNRKKK